MPLTPFQAKLLATLAGSAAQDRYLAGGAAMHFTPQSERFSDDLDFFHDSEARVAAAYNADRQTLEAAGYVVDTDVVLPGFVRAVVHKDGSTTRIDWAHDSAWRFLPLVQAGDGIWLLSPIDLAINKLLALAGRDEPRDFVDIMFVHRTVLPLAALVWAAVGKDPGLTPLSLIELLKRRGRPRAEEIQRLHLNAPFDLAQAKADWLEALGDAEQFVHERPPTELGCLYYDLATRQFVRPDPRRPLADQGVVTHFGRPGGVLPQPHPSA